jgi:hypothetical protein
MSSSLARSASNFRVIKANKRESTDDQGYIFYNFQLHPIDTGSLFTSSALI